MKRLRSLSDATRRFLAAGEGQLVDFKRSSDGISADDLVSFANSAEGGTILAGVDEQTVDGAQIGVIRGCDIGDNAVLQLLNKAISCLPPVSVDIAIENLGDRPMMSISVPSSSTKPHCTPKGVYCRRDGSRNRALHPTELLSIFLETEARVFAERFESAADQISQEIGKLEVSLEGTIRNMSDQLGWAESNISDTSGTIDTVLAYAKLVNDETGDIAARLRTLFRQDAREDPVRQREIEKLTERFVDQIWRDKDLLRGVLTGGEFKFTLEGKPARELSSDEGRAAFDEACRVVRQRFDLTWYEAKCVRPTECEPALIQAIAAFLGGGNEAEAIGADIRGAFRIGYTTYKKAVVAVVGLRKPKVAERAALFARAGATADHKLFKTQLEWLGLHPDHRGKGQLTKLVDKVLASVQGRPVFVLVEKDHEIVRDLLLKAGFRLAGGWPDAPPGGGKAGHLYLRDGG